MYKVFYNNRVLILEGTAEGVYNNPQPGNYTEINDFGDLQEIVFTFLESNVDKITLRYDDERALWNQFRKLFHNIQAAGGLVYKNGEALFIFRNGKWDLPKGKIENGESPHEASVREVKEETGLPAVKIKKRLDPTYHVFQSDHPDHAGRWTLKETFWYEMEYNGNVMPRPQTEEGITETKWFRPETLTEVLGNTWDSLFSIIRIISRSS